WQLKLARARLASSESALAAAEVDRSYATIRAPIGGTVASVSTQEGETVATGQPVTFTVEANPSAELAATVTRIDPTPTIVSGVVNYPVTAAITGTAR